MAVSHVFTTPVADATGTVTNWVGATTASALATEQVRPSDWNSAHNNLVTLSGNTAGVSTLSGTNIVYAGSNNVTVSGVQGANAATVHFSAAAGGGGGGSLNVSAGTTSNNLTALTFADSNGVSFGLNGSVVTATVKTDYLTSQSNQNITAANGGFAFQTLSFSNANGVSFGTSAGSAITASVATTYRASNDAIGLATAQSNVTWTVNSAGLSFDARGYAGTGTTFNGANVSGSMTVNSVGVQLSLSAGAAGGETRLTAYAQSNTTQSSSGTIALSSLNFAGAGIASVGVTNGSVVISVPAGGGAGDGGVFAGVSDLGNTAGSTGTVSTGNFVLVGSNGITLSQSTGAAGSAATITINGPQQTVYFTRLDPAVGMFVSVLNFAVVNNSVAVYPFDLSAAVDASCIAFPVIISNSSTGSSSGRVGYTLQVGIYTQGTNTTKIDSMYTTSYTLAASNSSNASRGVTWIDGIVNGTSYSTNSSSSAGTALSSLFQGSREFQVAYQTTLTPGRYWLACRMSTSVAGTSNGVLSIHHQIWRLGNEHNMLRIGSRSDNASYSGGMQMMGLGTYSVTSGGLPSSIGYSDLRRENNLMYPLAYLRRSIY